MTSSWSVIDAENILWIETILRSDKIFDNFLELSLYKCTQQREGLAKTDERTLRDI